MGFLLAYWVFLITTISLSWRAAPKMERRIIAAIILATLTTFSVNAVLGVTEAMAWVSIIDLLLFAFVFRCALYSQYFWPIWFAGLHGAALLASAAGLIFGSSTLFYFQTVAGFWAIPALIIMTVGTYRDGRITNHHNQLG